MNEHRAKEENEREKEIEGLPSSIDRKGKKHTHKKRYAIRIKHCVQFYSQIHPIYFDLEYLACITAVQYMYSQCRCSTISGREWKFNYIKRLRESERERKRLRESGREFLICTVCRTWFFCMSFCSSKWEHVVFCCCCFWPYCRSN